MSNDVIAHGAIGTKGKTMASKKATKKLKKGTKVQPKKALARATYNVGTAVSS